MPNEAEEKHIARTAADIMFGDKYLDLLDSIYSERDTIVEFETNPKQFLIRNGIDIPEQIDVIIHDPGELGRPARVDFHWGKEVQTAHSNMRAARQKLRELARAAWDVLHTPEMARLRKTVTTSPDALKEFASSPAAYAAAQGVVVPKGMDVIVHEHDPNGLRIDLHFKPPGPISHLRTENPGSGCCYCSDGGCCYYYHGYP